MCNVLLVDDEYMVISGITYLIPWEELGLTLVGTAYNGEEALEIITEKEVDIVISDITMPIMTGLEFLSEARKREKEFQIIYLSGYQEFEYVKEGMSLGALNYLLKPVDKRELLKTLEVAIEKVKESKDRDRLLYLTKRKSLKNWLVKGEDEKVTTLFPLLESNSYNAFVGSFKDPKFLETLDKEEDIHYFTENNERIFGIILNRTKIDLKSFYVELARKYPEDVFLFAGPLVNEVSDLKKSYEVAVSLEDSYYFYNLIQKGCIWIELNNHLEEIYYNTNEELPLLSKVSQDNTLEDKINMILDFFNATPIPPNHIRYFTLLLLSDARSYYDIKQPESYQQEVDRIRNITNINEIKTLFKSLEREISQLLDERSYNDLTHRVIDKIREGYSEDLRLKEVADDLFVNVMYLGQTFKRDTNQTFSQYLNEYRMKKAEELLLKSNRSVNEIAQAVGYSSSGYFYKNFRDAYGITPKDFRGKYLSI